jgi:hypothetical protein
VKTSLRLALAPAIALLFLLDACSRPAPQAQDFAGPVDPHRVALPVADATPATATGTADWSMVGDTAQFGVPGATPLLTLACHDARLVITRPIAAEVGAGALFAIEGPKRIVRIPVDATAVAGKRGYVWQGSMDGTDPDTDVFEYPFTGTLPGGGLIKVTAGSAARDVVHRCRKT